MVTVGRVGREGFGGAGLDSSGDVSSGIWEVTGLMTAGRGEAARRRLEGKPDGFAMGRERERGEFAMGDQGGGEELGKS